MSNRKMRWIVWILSMAAAACMCFAFNGMRREAVEALSLVEEPGQEEKGLQVFTYALEETGKGYVVTPWFSGKEGKHLLFIPDWVSQIAFSQAVVWEGREIGEGEKIYLDETQYALSCEGKEYLFEIVRLSRIPTIYMDTETGSLDFLRQSKEHKETVQIRTVDETGRTAGWAFGQAHCRGNVTFEESEKKSYTLELDADTDLYGMGAARKWVLQANVCDSTSIRNYLTFYMAREMNMYGTPEAEWVDVFANGEYQGIYLLCEKIEIGEARLDFNDLEAELEEKNDLRAVKESNYSMISSDGKQVRQKGFRLEYEPEDISGGYLLELEEVPERYEEEKSGFLSDAGQQVVIKSPQYASADQVKYISGLYQKMEDALLHAGEDAEELLKYVDLESFAKKYLIEEVSKNMDASVSSLYLYKPEDVVSSKLYAGPVWDYDRAYGNMGKLDDNLDMRSPEGMFVQDGYYGSGFWPPFCWNPHFRESVRAIYREEMLPVIEKCVQEKIPQWEQSIRTSVYADMMRWPDREEEVADYQNLSYEEKVDIMIAFLEERSLYLKTVWECE